MSHYQPYLFILLACLRSVRQAWELYANGPEDCDPIWYQTQDVRDPARMVIKGTSITVLECELE